MFIASMPCPLHLRQLADAVCQAMMDDTGISEVHLARLEHERSIFFPQGSFPCFGDGNITQEIESRHDANLAVMCHRKRERDGRGSGHH